MQRCLLELQQAQYITKEKVGRHNVYTLREKVSIKDSEGRPQAVATWDYIPNSVKDAMAELKHAVITGDMVGGSIIHIENLVLNMNITGDNSTQVNINAADFDKLPANIKEKLAEMRSALKPKND